MTLESNDAQPARSHAAHGSDVRPKSVKFRWAGMDATCDICGKQSDKIWWRSGEVLGAACRAHVKDVMQLGIVGKMFEQLTKLQKPK